jgi:hypothetical protein
VTRARGGGGLWVLALLLASPGVRADLEDLGRGIERPAVYTRAALDGEHLLVRFDLARVPGYRHPYGLAEAAAAPAWAEITLAGRRWQPVAAIEPGPFQANLDLERAAVQDDLAAFDARAASAAAIRILAAEPIILWGEYERVRRGAPTVEQAAAAIRETLGAAAARGEDALLQYNQFGSFALLRHDPQHGARVTLIDPPHRFYRTWWHGAARVALYPVALAGAGLYVIGCLLGGCH